MHFGMVKMCFGMCKSLGDNMVDKEVLITTNIQHLNYSIIDQKFLANP